MKLKLPVKKGCKTVWVIVKVKQFTGPVYRAQQFWKDGTMDGYGPWRNSLRKAKMDIPENPDENILVI